MAVSKSLLRRKRLTGGDARPHADVFSTEWVIPIVALDHAIAGVTEHDVRFWSPFVHETRASVFVEFVLAARFA